MHCVEMRKLKWLLVMDLLTLLADAYNLKSRENAFLQCNKSILSDHRNKTGVIESPRHPERYPTNIICEYEFRALGHERIQLNFTRMNLYYSSGDPNDPYQCSNHDSIKVFIYIGEEEKEELVGEYCGKKRPPLLMSSGQRMKVIFKSESLEKDIGNSGFSMIYSFRTDFGVQGNGRQDDREVCSFRYNSSIATNGTFTSPNFPGQYPRKIKCDYLFYGRKPEKVNITFITFDVGCDGRTNSDHVAFSNFLRAEDRKMKPYCGNRRYYEPVVSDAAFFKVTFVSNDRFDANGFKGIYTFKEDETIQTPYPPEPRDQDVSLGSRANASITMVTIILLCNAVIDCILRH